MAFIAAAATIVGTAYSIYASMRQQGLAEQAAELQERLARRQVELEAQMLEYQAWSERRASEFSAMGLDAQASASLAGAAIQRRNALLAEGDAEAALEVAAFNAAMTEFDADASDQALVHQLGRHRRDLHRLLGAQRAGYARAGVVVGSGTPLVVMGETAAEAAIDAEAMIAAGVTRSTRFRMEGALALYEGEVISQRFQGQASIGRMLAAQLENAGMTQQEMAAFQRETGADIEERLRDMAERIRRSFDDALGNATASANISGVTGAAQSSLGQGDSFA